MYLKRLLLEKCVTCNNNYHIMIVIIIFNVLFNFIVNITLLYHKYRFRKGGT